MHNLKPLSLHENTLMQFIMRSMGYKARYEMFSVRSAVSIRVQVQHAFYLKRRLST